MTYAILSRRPGGLIVVRWLEVVHLDQVAVSLLLSNGSAMGSAKNLYTET